MSIPREQIEENLGTVRGRMAAAAGRAGRRPGEVKLVAVTKSVGLDEILTLSGMGVTDMGENRPETSVDKLRAMAGKVCRHMIGNLQSRKVRGAVDLFDRIDAVDRIEMAEALERRCAEVGRIMPVLIEVNVSGEASKHGFQSKEVSRVLDAIAAMPHLRVEGLMTMAPAVENPEEIRPVFRTLRVLAQTHALSVVSMGMSDDFEVAIEEGSTEVRIGSALFK